MRSKKLYTLIFFTAMIYYFLIHDFFDQKIYPRFEKETNQTYVLTNLLANSFDNEKYLWVNTMKEIANELMEYNCKINTETVILMNSNPENFNTRLNVRNSFGRNRVKYFYNFSNLDQKEKPNISHCFLFMVGKRNDTDLNMKLYKEYMEFRDVILTPVGDTYRSTSNKITLSLYLINLSKIKFKYILKIDDDIFVKISEIIPFLNRIDENINFGGKIAYYLSVVRDPQNKFYISFEEYPQKFFPPYLLGPCYFIRRSIVDKLIKNHLKRKFLAMEDVYISILVIESGYNVTELLELSFEAEKNITRLVDTVERVDKIQKKIFLENNKYYQLE